MNFSKYLSNTEIIINKERELMHSLFQENSVNLIIEQIQIAMLVTPLDSLIANDQCIKYIVENERI